MGRAMGGYAERIEKPVDIVPALERARKANEGGQAVLLEFITSEEIAFSHFTGESVSCDPIPLASVVAARTLETATLCGTPRHVADRLAELRDAGVEHVLCQMSYGHLPHATIMGSMRRFGEAVSPDFAEAPREGAGRGGAGWNGILPREGGRPCPRPAT